jgi:hypothetical protein
MESQSTTCSNAKAPSWEEIKKFYWAIFWGFGHITTHYGLESGPAHVRR